MVSGQAQGVAMWGGVQGGKVPKGSGAGGCGLGFRVLRFRV